MENMIDRLDANPPHRAYPEAEYIPPWHQSPRAKLFAIIFGATLVVGLIGVALQPNIYRSSATVLMSAPSAIDTRMVEADTQNVAIQRRILLGSEITSRTLTELNQQQQIELDSTHLKALLRVDAVPDTNLVEMVAQGAEQEILPILVNSWIDVYIEARATDVAQSKSRTTQIVQDELDSLASKLDTTRASLELFREENNIISAERQENEVLARLEGLNTALNNAIEAEAKARAYLDTVQETIGNGGKVIPKDDLNNLRSLETELQTLQAEMLELNKRYTEQYINKQPALRSVAERIEVLKKEITARLATGQKVELAAAQQAQLSARKTVMEIERQLEDHKQKVAQFSTLFATHQALVSDLQGLEELNRETQARLVQVEVSRVEKYPQVAVIARPEDYAERIGPNYLMLCGYVLATALGLGVLAVWLLGFLGHKRQQPAYVTLSGVHMYPPESTGELSDQSSVEPRLAADSRPRLDDGSAKQ